MTLVLGVVAGSLGAIARHSMLTWLRARRGSATGLAVVNLLGATAIGVVMGLDDLHALRFAVVGFLGGFTTFSTLMSETIELVTGTDGRLYGLLYPVAQTVAGAALVAVGFTASTVLTNGA